MAADDACSRGARQFNAPLVACGLGRGVAELLGAVGDVEVVGVQELAGVGNRMNAQPLTEVGGFFLGFRSSAKAVPRLDDLM